MSANVNAIIQPIASPVMMQIIVWKVDPGSEKMRLYNRRTLILVIPTAGQVSSESAYVACLWAFG